MNQWYPIVMIAGALVSLPSTGNQLISGFSKWQANRIERIVIDQTLEDIADQPYVKKYFTQTSQAISFYDTISGQRLIPLMQLHYKEDIKKFDQATLCLKREIKEGLNTQDISRLNNALNQAKQLVDSNSDSSIQDFLSSDSCTGYNNPSLTKNRVITPEIKKIDFSQLKSVYKDSKVKKNIELIERLLKLIEQVENSIQAIKDESTTYLAQAHQMLQIIDLLGKASEDLFDFKGYNLANLNRLKSISLFLAELADASNDQTKGADKVVAILTQYVNEQDTYNRKRHNTGYIGWVRKNDYTTSKPAQINYLTSCRNYGVLPCRDTLFLSSYYGLSIMKIDDTGGEKSQITGRAYGPIGVELKIANFRGSPITLGYAPIDIGNYVTAELKGDNYDAQTEDILAPSIFLSWSAASRPFSILAGYQKDIKIDNGLQEDAIFISFAFDLPIATIF